jgi:hypothetical protein
MFRVARCQGAKLFASRRGPARGEDCTGLMPDGGTIVRLPRSKADSAAGEWEFHVPLFSTSLPSGRLVMRRKVNGKWQYRSPTPAEEQEYVASEGW